MPAKNIDLTFISHDPNDRHYTTAARSHNARMRGKHLNVNQLSLATANQAKQSKAFVFRTQVKNKCPHGHSKVEKQCPKCNSPKKKPVKKKEITVEEDEVLEDPVSDLEKKEEEEEAVARDDSSPEIGPLADPRMNYRSGFPLSLNENDSRLVNVWLSVAPNMFCLPQVTNPKSMKDPRSVFFPLAMSSEAAFRSIVLLPAAFMNDLNPESINYQKAQAFRLVHNIQERLYERGTLDPPDYVAFPALYHWQRWHGDDHGAQVISESHFQALEWRLQRGIQPPGKEGMLAVEWFNLMSSTHPQQLPLNAQNEHSAKFLKGLFENLMTSLHNVQELARTHTIFARSMGMDRRIELFQPHTNLYKILTSVPDEDDESDQEPTEQNIYFLRVCQFKILLYIHLGLLLLSDDNDAQENYIKELEEAVARCDSSNPQDAIIFLLWIMINNDTLSTPETSHQVVVAMIPHIASRFRRWHNLSRYLMEWLRIRDRSEDDQAGSIYPFQEINMSQLKQLIWREMGWTQIYDQESKTMTSPTVASSFVYSGVNGDQYQGEQYQSEEFYSPEQDTPEFVFQENGMDF